MRRSICRCPIGGCWARPATAGALGAVLALGASTAQGGFLHAFLLSSPLLDQWAYPFAASPGGSAAASIFGAWIDGGYAPQWDNRDGQMLVAFDTSAVVPTGLDPSAYSIASLRLSLTIGLDGAFEYDPTQDPLESWMPDKEGKPAVDPDPGRPVELFATDFRSGFTALTYTEQTPYGPSTFGKAIRYAYPVMFIDGMPHDVSNNVDELLEVEPAAVGTIKGLAQGDPVPIYSVMRFDLDLAQPALHAWLVEGLRQGRVFLSAASLFHTEVGGTSGFPRFLTKESPEVILGLAAAPTLEGVVKVCEKSPDLDGDGAVDGADLGLLLAGWGPCPVACPCAGDLDGDGEVGGADLGALLAAWSDVERP